MKTLSGSYLKLFMYNQRGRERVVLSSREVRHQNSVRNGFCPAVSFRRVRPISAVSSPQTVGSEELQTISTDQPKTVYVRFKLQKECAFGQQFLIVGDDPILGSWDPSEGVPLNWSEGHVWTAEMDVPIDKVMKYKFILKGNAATLSWQTGPDRVLETWETEKIISVSEDWNSPDLQTVVEEDFADDPDVEPLISSDLLMVAEDFNEEGDYAIKKLANGNDDRSSLDEPYATMVAENISGRSEGQDLSLSDEGYRLVSTIDEKEEERGNDGSVANENDSSSFKDETRPFLDEGVPVLVPGLVPVPTDEIEAVEVIAASDEIKDSAESELKGEDVSASLLPSETGEMVVDEKQQLDGKETASQSKDKHVPASLHHTETDEITVDVKQQHYKEQMESNVLESDVQWGRRTLQKFLANLGFI